MKITHEFLAEIDSLKKRNRLLEEEVAFYREKFKLAQHKQFGASSEKSPDQLDWLFNEAEAIVDTENTEVTVETTDVDSTASTAATITKKTGRKPLPQDLPRETRMIDVAAADKICPCCNGD